MPLSSDIWKHYKPVQPAIKQPAEKVVYEEFMPDTRLQSFIYCYWQLHTTAPLTEPFYYRVVADGCIDIFFELNNPQQSFVMGFCKQYTEFLLENTFHYVGVRFMPTMFPQLFNINAQELSNRFEELRNVLPAVSVFITVNFKGRISREDIRRLFDTYFLGHLANTPLYLDGRLYQALDIIYKQRGIVNVQSELDTGISPRQLRRLFQFYIGDTAKTFSQVVRFQNLLATNPSSQILREDKFFFDAGYYDQAHFIKEFRNFYGVTPGQAFRQV